MRARMRPMFLMPPMFLSAYAIGSVTVKVVPSASVLVQVMSPSCERAISRAMASPSPNPPAPEVRALSVR